MTYLQNPDAPPPHRPPSVAGEFTAAGFADALRHEWAGVVLCVAVGFVMALVLAVWGVRA